MSLKENINTQEASQPSLSQHLNLIYRLISPSLVGKKKKIKKTQMKCLFSIMRMHFFNQQKRRSSDYFGIERLSDWAGVSERSFKSFISLKDGAFHHFGCVREQAWISNEYYLSDWVKQLFYLFMDMNAMRGMKSNFNVWEKRFKKRLIFLIQLAEEGKNLAEIREIVCSKPIDMNKLRTKRDFKLPAGTGLNCPLSPPFGSPLNALDKTDLGDSISRDFKKIRSALEGECSLQGSDVWHILNQYSLGSIRKGLYLREEYVKKGSIPQSPIKFMMHCIKMGRLARA